MNELSIIRGLNWRLNLAVLFLLAASLIGLASFAPDVFYKQVLWALLGLVAIFIIIQFDWRPFANYRTLIFGFYFLMILLLVATHFFAPTIRGAKSWLPVGGFRFQPAEFTKIALILLYSLFFSRKHAAIARASNLMVSFIYFLIPGFLIAIQPDFGSLSVLFSIWFGFLLISGIRWRHLVIMLIILVIVSVAMWNAVLKNYQKERILGFVFPTRDVLGINYSVVQAKIAIGSAGFFGKGFRQGTQSQLGFLPEKQTDFIFSALVEEWGLVAAFLLVAAFVFMIFEIIKIGLGSPNNFSRFICLGAVILFCVQFALNMGSNLGLTPVIGITLPFLSYGGSSLLTDLILIGIIQSISIRRPL